MPTVPRIAVVTADEARELDARAIAGLPDSFVLMQRAATAAAQWLQTRPERGAAVFVGPGNNGGDGWLIAALLRANGWSVSVREAAPPKTPDAIRAKAVAEADGGFAWPSDADALIIDALLGTGATGALRGPMADVICEMRALVSHVVEPHGARASRRTVVAIDLPSGLDATTGDDNGAVPADVTLTFGTVKRGLLRRRDLTGALRLLDIGLPDAGSAAARLVDAASVASWLPALAPDAYKGTRGRVAIVGGDNGMAGAVILAARGAHASGAGMVRTHVASASATALQIAAPFATTQPWRGRDWCVRDVTWPSAMCVGPGLDGTQSTVREQLLELLYAYRGPVVLDAGALSAFAPQRLPDDECIDDAAGVSFAHLEPLRHALGGRVALLTPHAGEFRAMYGAYREVDRYDAPMHLARLLNTTVLMKGVPTVIASPDGARYVSATGNPALAVGGSGDLLTGIAGALLSQGLSALEAGAAAAWVHGTAADRVAARHGGWRGVTLEMLVDEVGRAWPPFMGAFVESESSVLVAGPFMKSESSMFVAGQ